MIGLDSFHTRRWYRIAASFFFFLQGLTFASWASRIPDIKNFLQLSTASLGGVLFALPVGQLSAMALSGYLVSRYGSKKMLTIAAVFYPLALVGIGAVTSVWHLIGALFLFGVTGNLINISVNTQAVGVERIYGRSIMASFHGLWSLAGFTGGLLSTVMVKFSLPPLWHFAIIYVVALSILATMHGSLIPRDVVRKEGASHKKMFLMPDKFITILGLIVFGSMICEGAMFDWSSIYFEEVIKPSENLVRLGYIAFMSTMALGRFTADRLVNKLGIVRMIQVSGVMIALGLLLAVVVPTLITATVGFLMVGFGTSSIVPLCYSMAGRSKTMLPGIALATVSTIGFMGFLIGPPIIGFIAEWWSMRWSFALIAAIGLTTTFLAPKLRKYSILQTRASADNYSVVKAELEERA